MTGDNPLPYWLDARHPNFERWKRGRELARDRALIVKSIISLHEKTEGMDILDLGSGEGGTSILLHEENRVVSFDINPARLENQKQQCPGLPMVRGDALALPFRDESFDVIILQDVLEHLLQPEDILRHLHTMLKPSGIVYISTPNRLSIANMPADPHWGLLYVSLMPRSVIERVILPVFRPGEVERYGIAELLSMRRLYNMFEGMFTVHLHSRFMTNQMFNRTKGIIWSDLHIRMREFYIRTGLGSYFCRIMTDTPDWINNWLTPNFYFILEKK